MYLYREQAQHKSLDVKCCQSMNQKRGKLCVTVCVWYHPLCVFNDKERDPNQKKVLNANDAHCSFIYKCPAAQLSDAT